MQKTNKLSYVGFLILSVIILLLFSTRTSPIYSVLCGDYYNNEVSHAMLIGKYWLQGVIPYKELFYVGSPFYFAIQALGWRIGERTGIFLLQILNFTICLVFTKKTAKMFVKEKKAFLLTSIIAFPYIAMCSGGNSASEWNLALNAISIWIVFSEVNKERNSSLKMVAMSFMAIASLVLDYQSSAIIVSVFLYCIWLCTKKRKFKTLVGMFLGFSIPIVVVLVYFSASGCLEEMIKGAFVYPIQLHIQSAFMSTDVLVHKAVKSCLAMPFFAADLYYVKKRKNNVGTVTLVMAVCNIIALLISDNSWPVFLCSLPSIVIAIAMIGYDVKWKKVAAALVIVMVCIISAIPLKDYFVYLSDGELPTEDFYQAYTEYCELNPNAKIRMIDVDSSFLLEADKFPEVKYFAGQTKLAELDADIEKKLEEYTTCQGGADLLITQERRWGAYASDDFTLTQVYIKLRGNISIYVKNTLTEDTVNEN